MQFNKHKCVGYLKKYMKAMVVTGDVNTVKQKIMPFRSVKTTGICKSKQWDVQNLSV